MLPHRFLACLLTAIFLGVAGCTPHSDAMKGWRGLGSFSNTEVPETIKQDALAFFKTLPKEEKDWAENQADFAIMYWEDGTGQHAVRLQCPHDGEAWYYALIYDRNNRRIKVIKYSTTSYMC